MSRWILAALAGLALGMACVPAPPTDDGRLEMPVAEPLRVPYIPPLPGEPGYGAEETVPLTGVADSGGTRPVPGATVDPARYPELFPRGPSAAPTVRRWPWEDKGLAAWERWFAVHGRAWLAAAGRPADAGDAPDGTPEASPVDLAGARRWLGLPRERELTRATALAVAGWNPELAPALVEALRGASDDRSDLCWALGTAGGDPAAAALLALLDDPKTAEAERLVAAVALGRCGGPRAVTALAGLVRDRSRSDAQRYAAALGLALAGDRTAATGLLDVAGDRDAAPRVRAAALCAATRLDPEAGGERCRAVLGRGGAPGADPLPVRLAAVEALAAGGRPDAVATLQAALTGTDRVPRFEREALAAACEGLDRSVAARCREALAAAVAARGPRSIDEAVAVACEAAPARARDAVAAALRRTLGRVGVAGIIEDESVRGLAALGLGTAAASAEATARAAAARALTAALDDAHYAVRGFAALGLGATGDPAARGPLRALLRAGDPSTRAAAAIALGRLGDQAAARALAQLAASGDPLQRWGALWGLGLLGDRAALPPAGRLLERRSHPDLRAAAAATLAAVPGPEAETLLQRTLPDRHATVRAEAARSLGRRATPATLAAAARALRGPLAPDDRITLLDVLAAAHPRHLEAADLLQGWPAEVVPELAAALLRTIEPAYRPARP